jgi:NAD-dependent deacetylase
MSALRKWFIVNFIKRRLDMKIVAFTGAGISKTAGIPTFEEIPGIKEKLSVEFKESYPKEFEEAINLLKTNVADKEPTKAHKILAELQIPIITMNVDNLHTRAGSQNVIELHGNYLNDNIVLYGQEMHDSDKAIKLIQDTAKLAKDNNEKAFLLIIGTSMQTAFANILVLIARANGMKDLYIDKNADEEVEQFFKLIQS